MEIHLKKDLLVVSDISEIVASNSRAFKERVLSALTDGHTTIELDLSNTEFVDSSGLGSLISLDKALRSRQGVLRLRNPRHSVLTILELTRLHRVFEVVVDSHPVSNDSA
jgi:anti-sigma B factor antagonist